MDTCLAYNLGLFQAFWSCAVLLTELYIQPGEIIVPFKYHNIAHTVSKQKPIIPQLEHSCLLLNTLFQKKKIKHLTNLILSNTK